MLMSLNCSKCHQWITPDQEEVFLSNEVSNPVAAHMNCLTADTHMPADLRARFNTREILKLQEQNRSLTQTLKDLLASLRPMLRSQGVDPDTMRKIEDAEGQFRNTGKGPT